MILDIRPHPSYVSARLPSAISLSVPSTLLKRPTFTLEKLYHHVAHRGRSVSLPYVKQATRVLVYDADSNLLADGNNVLGLLRKFHSEGFTGELAWLKGGLQ